MSKSPHLTAFQFCQLVTRQDQFNNENLLSSKKGTYTIKVEQSHKQNPKEEEGNDTKTQDIIG